MNHPTMNFIQIDQNSFSLFAGILADGVSHSCNPSTGRPGEANALSSGSLLDGQ